MKRSTAFVAAAAAGILALAGGSWFLIEKRTGELPSGPAGGVEGSLTAAGSDVPRYAASAFEIAVRTEPATPRVGENRLIVELRTPDGQPASGVSIEAFAEMPAMGAMPAMRAPVELSEAAPGLYTGTLDLPGRGDWPLTLSFESPEGRSALLKFDLATGREGLTLASGARPVGGAAPPPDEANVITIDSRRRQMIGIETGKAAERDLVRHIRAVGEITFDERLLSHVTLKFDGYVGDLEADYVGAPVEKGQVLFTVYSPELLAAQQEYLETRKRRGTAAANDPLLRAARQRLALWDMSAGEIEALERRGTPRDYVPIYAPRSGTVIERNIADGSAAPMGQTLLTIADLSRVWIEAEVFEADLELVREGMEATVTLPYLPARTYAANVDYVYPWLQGETRTGRIRLSVGNPDGDLKPDMYAEVSLHAALGRRLSVPEEAVIVAGDSRIVFVDLGGGRLKPTRIKTGRRAEGFVEVLEALAPGDTVVTSGNFLLAAETRLKTGIEQW
jgi:Cu(I)/Ag(I) efflux system membrane fusion protein